MKIESGVDAIFLPGKIHGCEEELYIIYFNAEGNEGKGCMEIEIVDYETILDLYKDTEGDCARFFCIMPDYFHGKWKYEPYGTDGFDELAIAKPRCVLSLTGPSNLSGVAKEISRNISTSFCRRIMSAAISRLPASLMQRKMRSNA